MSSHESPSRHNKLPQVRSIISIADPLTASSENKVAETDQNNSDNSTATSNKKKGTSFRSPSGLPHTRSTTTVIPASTLPRVVPHATASSGLLTAHHTIATAAPTTLTTASSPIHRQVIGKYEMGTALASGDFDSRTRLCSHIVTGATYVVRIYDKAVLAEEQWMWERVRASIHVQRALPKHENIVEMVECFETSSSLYILMQLFQSTNLTKLLCGNRFQRLLQTGVPNGAGMMHDKCFHPSPLASSRTFLTGSTTDHETVGEGQVGNSFSSSLESVGNSDPHIRQTHQVSGGLPSMTSFPSPVSLSPPLVKYTSMVPAKEEDRPTTLRNDPEEAEDERVRSEERNGKTRGGIASPSSDHEVSLSLSAPATIASKITGNVMYSTVVDPIVTSSPPLRSSAGAVKEGSGSAFGPLRAISVTMDATASSPSFSAAEMPLKERRKRWERRSGATDDGAAGHSSVEGAAAPSHVSSVIEKKGRRSDTGDDGVEPFRASPGMLILPKSFGPPRGRSRLLRPPSTASSNRRSCLRSVLTSEEVRQYFSQVVRGVEHMHSHHIVHLGIAPDHILIDDRGLCKVSNLISCCYCTPGKKMNELRGTRHTVAPEILSSDPFDPYLADAWSLGILLYFMFHGRYPHDGANTLEHIMSHHLRPPAISIPSTAKDLLRSLLEPDPLCRLSVSHMLEHPFFHVDSFLDDEEEEENSFTTPSGVPVSSRPPSTRRRSHHLLHAHKKTPKGDRPVPPGDGPKAIEKQSGNSEISGIILPLSSLSDGRNKDGKGGVAENYVGLSRPHAYSHQSSLPKSLHEGEEEEKEEERLPSSSVFRSPLLQSSLHNSTIEIEEVGETALKRLAPQPKRPSARSSPGTNHTMGFNEGIEEVWDASGGLQAPLSPPTPLFPAEYPPSNTTRSLALLPAGVSSSAPPSMPWGKGVGRHASPVTHSSTISFRLASATIPAAVVGNDGGEAGEGIEMKVAGGSSPSQGPVENAALVPGSFRALMQKHFTLVDRTFHSLPIEGEERGAEERRRSPSSGSSRSSTATSTPVTALSVVPQRAPLAPSGTADELAHPTPTSGLGTEMKSVLSSNFPLGTPYGGEGPVEGGARWRSPLGVHATPPSFISFASPSEYSTSSAVMHRRMRKKKIQGSPQTGKSDPLRTPPVDGHTSLCVPWSPASPSLSSFSSTTSMDSPTQKQSDVAHQHPQRQRATKMMCVDSVEGLRNTPTSSALGVTLQGLCPTCHRLPSSIGTRSISQMPYSTTRFTFHPPNAFELTEKN